MGAENIKDINFNEYNFWDEIFTGKICRYELGPGNYISFKILWYTRTLRHNYDYYASDKCLYFQGNASVFDACVANLSQPQKTAIQEMLSS